MDRMGPLILGLPWFETLMPTSIHHPLCLNFLASARTGQQAPCSHTGQQASSVNTWGREQDRRRREPQLRKGNFALTSRPALSHQQQQPASCGSSSCRPANCSNNCATSNRSSNSSRSSASLQLQLRYQQQQLSQLRQKTVLMQMRQLWVKP
jgi:hypothetical protein